MQRLIESQEKQIELLSEMLKTLQAQGKTIPVQVVENDTPKKVSTKSAKKLTLVKDHLTRYPDDMSLSSRKLSKKILELYDVSVSHTMISQIAKDIKNA